MQPQLAASGTPLAFVHMGTMEQGAELLARYGLSSAHQFADPGRELYRAFDLKRATLGQVVNPRVVARAFGTLFQGHVLTAPIGDPAQMPGVFLVHDGRIVREFRHESIGDRPDYGRLVGGA